MKRRQSENEVIFVRLPLHIIYKIQSMLKIENFIHFIETCKYLNSTQKLREEDIYNRCINGIKYNIANNDIYQLVQDFLPHSKGVIKGPLVNCLLQDIDITYPITIKVPVVYDLREYANFIEKYLNPEIQILSGDAKKLMVCDKHTHNVLLIIDKTYTNDMYKEDKVKSLFLRNPEPESPYTDLFKFYSPNLWKFLLKNQK